MREEGRLVIVRRSRKKSFGGRNLKGKAKLMEKAIKTHGGNELGREWGNIIRTLRAWLGGGAMGND